MADRASAPGSRPTRTGVAGPDGPRAGSTTPAPTEGVAPSVGDSGAPTDPRTEPVGLRPHVTAVLVAHDGARWLPTTLAAVRAQTRRPDVVIGVDTGSVDDSARQIARALGSQALVHAPRATGYGAAVAAGLAAPAAGGSSVAGPTTATPPTAGATASPDRPGSADRPGWVWLLHDDSAPDPDALAALLTHAADHPSVVLLGPKTVDWDQPQRLVEVGLTTDGRGRRDTGLEPVELDQGQHDVPRDVLTVCTAGALVRRDVWAALGGLDPQLPLLHDDVDLGWRLAARGGRCQVVPAARVRHARATLRGVRRRDALPGPLRRLDRQHALYVPLANAGPVRAPLTAARLAVGTVLRVLLLLLTRRPLAALDELAGFLGVLGHPGRLRAARRWRRAHQPAGSRPDRRAVHPLLTPRTARVRAVASALADVLTGGATAPGPGVLPASEVRLGDLDDAPPSDVGLGRRILGRPVVAVLAGLTLVGLVHSRPLLGGGALHGGRWLPVPGGAHTLWARYAASVHAAGLGSVTPLPPLTPLLAVLSLPFGGDSALLVWVLAVGAVPLAGASAWLALRRLALRPALRAWAALTYAALPVTTSAVAQGRLDVVVAAVTLPLVLAGAARVLTGDPRAGGWWPAWATGLGVAVLVAADPAGWPPAVAGLLAGAVVVLVRHRPAAVRRAAAAVVAAVTPAVALWPWPLQLLHRPQPLLVGGGDPGHLAGVAGRFSGLDLLASHPGGPGQPTLWVGLLLAVAGLAALTRRSGVVAVGGALTVLGWAAAVATTRTAAGSGHGFPGVALLLADAGLLLAAAGAARGLRTALAQRRFGVRQPLAAALTAAVALTPALLLGGAALDALHGPFGRSGGLTGPGIPVSVGAQLPAFVVDDARRDPGQRVLLLTAAAVPTGAAAAVPTGTAAVPAGTAAATAPGSATASTTAPAPAVTSSAGPGAGDAPLPGAGVVRYRLQPVLGAVAGDEDLLTSPPAARRVAALVADLTTARGSDAAAGLATYAVRYVAAPAPVAPPLAAALDSQPGLSRVSVQGAVLLWRVLPPAGRAQLLGGAVAAAALAGAPAQGNSGRGPDPGTGGTVQGLPAGAEGLRAALPAGPAPRVLVLSVAADRGWRASVSGRRLTPAVGWGWAQAFTVPAGTGGALRVWHDARGRHLGLAAQAVGTVLLLVLAAPSARRRRDDAAEPGAGTLAAAGVQPADPADSAAGTPAPSRTPVSGAAPGSTANAEPTLVAGTARGELGRAAEATDAVRDRPAGSPAGSAGRRSSARAAGGGRAGAGGVPPGAGAPRGQSREEPA